MDDEEYILSARSRTTNLDPSSTIDFYFMAQPKVSIFECSLTSVVHRDMIVSLCIFLFILIIAMALVANS